MDGWPWLKLPQATKSKSLTEETIMATLNHISANFSLGTTNTITSTVATQCAINSKFTVPLAPLTNSALSPATDASTGLPFNALAVNPAGNLQANQGTVVVLGVNAAGTLRACQGTVVATALGVGAVAGAFIYAPQFPNLPDDFCPTAYFLVRNSPNASAFTPFTSSWTATGITCSALVQIDSVPPRPQIS
jgi:hypothetical protein